MIDWLYQVKKELKLAIKTIHLDNSGENKAFHKLIQFKPEFHIKFEFTAPGTPQQNSTVERAFATLFGKTRSMLNAARITIPLRKGLWAHCAALSVQLENIIVKEKKLQSASEKVYGSNPNGIYNMRTFGEMAIVARHSDKKIRNKLADRGNTVMFVGYAEFHEKDIYKFWHFFTNKTLMSRDVIWLNKTYSDHMDITKVNFVTSEIKAEEEVEDEDEQYAEQEGTFDIPSTTE
jgi:hypothetical protein